jgi:hypothetical protein
MNATFKVNFDRRRGLTYQDEAGTLLFSFDFAMPDGKRIIVYKAGMTGDLKPIPPDLSEAERSRHLLAFERVKQYVVSCGYKLYEDVAA